MADELAAHERDGRVAQSAYADLQHRFEVLGGYTLDQRVEATLSGLGFTRDERVRPPTGLSGGEQTRAALARLVIADPDLLLLDEFKSDRADDYLAGFPDHPHRGFETVTYMLAGAMRHEDHAGNRGDLVAGSVQWMTAGRGNVHSEMPQQTDGLMWGFQLWVNLPARDKMMAPRYQDIPPDRIREIALGDGVRERPGRGDARRHAGELVARHLELGERAPEGAPPLGVGDRVAEDVIATLARGATSPVEVVTGDRDLFAIVRDPQVRVLYTLRGVSELALVDEAWITAKYGIPGRGYLDYAILRGDPSDGLPGVAGIGAKTASFLLSRYGSLDAILAAPDLSPTIRARLRASAAYLAAARRVVPPVEDCPVRGGDGALPIVPADRRRFDELSEHLRAGPLERLLAAVALVGA
jgi:hypothetical protein